MISGILNIRKEAGYTSHDVVARLRGILKQKKIGHTGTLDPDATGVLPVCLGKATKACRFLENHDKSYHAVLLLGVSTDTEDMSGTVLEEREVQVSEEDLRRIILSFTGSYDQIPPMYSARKVGGRKLYELAREGLTVERQPAPVQIHQISIDEISLPRVSFRVTCSKGTYIRSLCRDIGIKAGCGGCMESLIRTRVGRFTLEDAFSLSEIERYQEVDRISEILMSIETVFDQYPGIIASEEISRLVYNGNPISLGHCSFQDKTYSEKQSADSLVRLYDCKGAFIGVYTRDRNRLKPVQMFYQPEQRNK